jgi:hypothetical protein
MSISVSEEQELQNLVVLFPSMLEKAVEDWGKYKAGVEAGVFTADQQKDVLDWFADFPRLWEIISPNFDPWADSGKPDPDKLPLWERAERFVVKLRGNVDIKSRLGIAPIIIAGVIVAGVLGAAGAVWAIGYVKKQQNISRLINEVTTGSLPAEVLTEAVKEEKASVFGEVGSLLKWAVIAGALAVGWPLISKLLKGKS